MTDNEKTADNEKAAGKDNSPPPPKADEDNSPPPPPPADQNPIVHLKEAREKHPAKIQATKPPSQSKPENK
jgi:hypothetical protein